MSKNRVGYFYTDPTRWDFLASEIQEKTQACRIFLQECRFCVGYFLEKNASTRAAKGEM